MLAKSNVEQGAEVGVLQLRLEPCQPLPPEPVQIDPLLPSRPRSARTSPTPYRTSDRLTAARPGCPSRPTALPRVFSVAYHHQNSSPLGRQAAMYGRVALAPAPAVSLRRVDPPREAPVPSPEVPPIGERIREERSRRAWTVRGLAREIGVSASLISQIETGKSQPSVSTLYAITTALQLPIEDLFITPTDGPGGGERRAAAAALGGEGNGGSATIRAGRRSRPARSAPRRRPCRGPDGPTAGGTRRPRRRPGDPRLESGVTWELLGQVPGSHVEFLRVTYPPGSASEASGQLMRHAGTEFGYLVAGELTLALGFEEHRLAPGDAFSFASSTPHRYRNDGPGSRRRHLVRARGRLRPRWPIAACRRAGTSRRRTPPAGATR